MVLYSLVWSCMALYGLVWSFTVFYGLILSSTVLYGIVWFCIGLYGGFRDLTLCHPAYWILVKVRGGVLRTHSYI